MQLVRAVLDFVFKKKRQREEEQKQNPYGHPPLSTEACARLLHVSVKDIREIGQKLRRLAITWERYSDLDGPKGHKVTPGRPAQNRNPEIWAKKAEIRRIQSSINWLEEFYPYGKDKNGFPLDKNGSPTSWEEVHDREK